LAITSGEIHENRFVARKHRRRIINKVRVQTIRLKKTRNLDQRRAFIDTRPLQAPNYVNQLKLSVESMLAQNVERTARPAESVGVMCVLSIDARNRDGNYERQAAKARLCAQFSFRSDGDNRHRQRRKV
jgi:hypothetical protein